MFNILAAKTVVQIIGLAVVTAGSPQGIDVVMPRIQSMPVHSHSTHQAQLKVSGRAVMTAKPLPQTPQPIEDHTPIIAFRTDAAPSGAGWIAKPLGPVPDYSYVVLNGEHLRFMMNGVNPVATVPAGLPRLGARCIDKSLSQEPITFKAGRGRIGQVQPAARMPAYKPTLNAGYQPPAYPQASAVLKVRAGEVTACVARVNGSSNGRIDTRIILDNDGEVILEATKNGTTRALRFTSPNDVTGEDTLVIIANVPNQWLASPPALTATAVDVGHFQAYYSMLDAAAATNCTRESASEALPACDVDMVILGSDSGAGTIPQLPGGTGMITYECSNSQYP